MLDSNPVPEAPSEIDDEFSLLDLAAVLAGNARALAIAPLLGGLLTFGVSWLIPPVYTSTTKILAPQQQQGSGAAALLGDLSSLTGGASAGSKSPADRWIGLLQSRTVADRIIARFDLKRRYDFQYLDDARKQLAERSAFSAGKDGLISIQVEDRDAGIASELAKAYVDELQKLSSGLAITEAAQRRLFFGNQLRDTKDKLTQAELALKESGLGPNIVKTNPEAAVSAIAKLKAEIASNEVRLQALRSSMTDNAPPIREALSTLAALRTHLMQTETAEPANRGNGTEYIARYRDFKYYEALFDMIARQYELARSDEAREGAIIQVVDSAEVPERKTRPKRITLALAGAVAALVGALVWTIVRNAILKSRADPNAADKWRTIGKGLKLRGS